MPKKERIREKYWSPDNETNIDFIEISLPNEAVDPYVNAHTSHRRAEEPEEKEKRIKRRERLVRKVMKAAAECLTDTQLRIFFMRVVMGMKTTAIAEKLDCDQGYVSVVLRVSRKKISKRLRLPTEE